MNECKYAVVGKDDSDNFRLSETLRHAYGNENVWRFLELQHLEPFLLANQAFPIVVCLDIFGFDLKEVTNFVSYIRDNAFPKVVFNLYLDQREYRTRRQELPVNWRRRFHHYHKTFKEETDIDFEPILRASLRSSQNEAIFNITNEPIRLTQVASKGVVEPEKEPSESETPIAFISYSRDDWDAFVSRFVTDISKTSQRIWIDREYIIGGDDWMNAIGEALDVCDILILVLSPKSLESRNVKMEYRYFLRQEKPIIPILYRAIEHFPFELASLHFLDFSNGMCERDIFELLKMIEQHRKKKG